MARRDRLFTETRAAERFSSSYARLGGREEAEGGGGPPGSARGPARRRVAGAPGRASGRAGGGGGGGRGGGGRGMSEKSSVNRGQRGRSARPVATLILRLHLLLLGG